MAPRTELKVSPRASAVLVASTYALYERLEVGR
jgi:hypothetical protein